MFIYIYKYEYKYIYIYIYGSIAAEIGCHHLCQGTQLCVGSRDSVGPSR